MVKLTSWQVAASCSELVERTSGRFYDKRKRERDAGRAKGRYLRADLWPICGATKAAEQQRQRVAI